MRRKASPTPVIVGTIIALLGILTGLYFAQNAREQQSQSVADAMPEVPQPAAPSVPAEMDEPLPAVEQLDGVVVDELPGEDSVTDKEEPQPVEETLLAEPADVPAAATADVPAETTTTSAQVDTTAVKHQRAEPEVRQETDTI